jgi:hypothetical protein
MMCHYSISIVMVRSHSKTKFYTQSLRIGTKKGGYRGSVEKPYLVEKDYLTVIPTKVEIHINQRDRFPLPRE